MNSKLNDFKKKIKNKKVAVLGIGISHTPLISYLYKLGADITAFDKSDETRLKPTLEAFKGMDIKYSLGEGYLDNLKGFDILFRTPGMRYDIPQILAAKEEGTEITSEMEVFFELCPAQIFAVTGSDGKTTTTTLIYNMLKEQGYNCWLGGNIGIPLLSKIDEIKDTDKVVLELSSFQLHTMTESPHIAVVTNVSPNHLDVHKSMDEYVFAKKNIFKHQSAEDKLVINFDNDITRGFANEAQGDVVYFSRKASLEKGAMLKDNMLIFKDGESVTEIVKADDIVIPGVHNIENFLAATAAVIDCVDRDVIKKVATTFTGVEHRIELVRELNGIKFYNDSIASSPTRTIAGLNSFKDKVILIAGGYDKKIPYDALGPVIAEKVKCLVLIGQTAPKIEKALKDETERTGKGTDIPVYRCGSLDEAVQTAYRFASLGDTIILSPASASFDMFKSFEERGNKFKEIVNSIKA
ncbi:UDP-N-acetylmuramoyl-L-alanine--D-glutamate ligase [Acetivibrio straminisolvens]|uniref:UDP-N-acetylmuramoylalanine--D-glutamate ligase n=1 Tax=Acetivibrio straminisolvens JCM 21531 TaxID=1294263 RepID=W4V1W7_9FIRM|nr:UDP-N-acetylmuramoyl-L-alanine--D-glutamate ligase [Acetivibrio straminisolvens]GAE87440.1 UDP-N-acetylmuramoylalanine-D-glutamate ligase [Acetivibrio straminisolvens JCM 21531]